MWLNFYVFVYWNALIWNALLLLQFIGFSYRSLVHFICFLATVAIQNVKFYFKLYGMIRILFRNWPLKSHKIAGYFAMEMALLRHEYDTIKQKLSCFTLIQKVHYQMKIFSLNFINIYVYEVCDCSICELHLMLSFNHTKKNYCVSVRTLEIEIKSYIYSYITQ